MQNAPSVERFRVCVRSFAPPWQALEPLARYLTVVS